MKTLLLALLTILSIQAQGTIRFYNHSIPKLDGSGTYDVWIWRDNTPPAGFFDNVGAGGGFVAALFFNGTNLASTFFRDTSAQFVFLDNQIVTIPGVPPGERARLSISVWAPNLRPQVPSYVSGYWEFTSEPLGGTNSAGTVFPTPGLTGWGPESGAGLRVSWVCACPNPKPCLELTTSTFQIRDRLQISWNTCLNVKYQLQASDSLLGAWTNVGAVMIGDQTVDGRSVSLTNTVGSFFRVVTVP